MYQNRQNSHASQFCCQKSPNSSDSFGKFSEGAHYSKQQQNTKTILLLKSSYSCLCLQNTSCLEQQQQNTNLCHQPDLRNSKKETNCFLSNSLRQDIHNHIGQILSFGGKYQKMSKRNNSIIFSILKAGFRQFNNDSGNTNCSHTYTRTHIDFNGLKKPKFVTLEK